ncbi:hypothetical protein SERLA73DRAFT_186193 [Serpula lacrymans var. lacrymans S7.3]|uniref:Uncharacterized protein n=2 Tax=Serpula lacrymans var. lacrymans TaxID=341189 RepID=F8Q5I5_SERL3|nr:uncharacterized protein SERLADRAFT_475110 [Serpula lacrymans var. lacrymans S7.9]EGN96456.1 hypothetical protein SERLA73DRAFT_186193 [Serpula lacrymans var. lacrymans S7.3]EGO22005.1 hypothetical protein SERLADRAFT_475110 [Serpula lacrymans var. lacrymans S7.9]
MQLATRLNFVAANRTIPYIHSTFLLTSSQGSIGRWSRQSPSLSSLSIRHLKIGLSRETYTPLF